jgi:hypothetical protein
MECSSLVTTTSLDRELAAARRRLADVAPDMAAVDFNMEPRDVAEWLDAVAGAAKRGEFVLPDDGEPQTLYLRMNDFEFNLDRWFLTPFANGPARAAETSFDWRDALIGEEIGSGLRAPDLSFTGMERVQKWFEQQDESPVQSAMVDVVLMAACYVVARSLPLTRNVSFRVAMSRGEEWRVCTWDTPQAEARVHTWHPTAD